MEVRGDSMRPTLLPGDRLAVVRGLPVRAGDVVALADPRRPDRIMVKRAEAETPGGWFVVGDEPGASTDSRHFGPVPAGLVIGRAVYRYAPDGRVGRLRRGAGRPPPTG
ncbi:MAG TPA: nickel-type superoxide dismutase maturation protease [Acidimicrobiales bacterium]